MVSSVAPCDAEVSSAVQHFNIYEKLRELYYEMCVRDQRFGEKRVKLRSRSYVLETLVDTEKLNTVILNLYPGNKGYSLAFRGENNSKVVELVNSQLESCYSSNRNAKKVPPTASGSTSTAYSQSHQPTMEIDNKDEDEEELKETMQWPYEIDDILDSIDHEELPIMFVDILQTHAPNVFYSGCIIVEVRDFRQSFPNSSCCDSYFVLLKPTNQTLLAGVNMIAAMEDFSTEDKLSLESQLVLATAEPLCLDPDPVIGKTAINRQHVRYMFGTSSIRRQMKRYSQVAINRKRKTDQFTHNFGLELNDYLSKMRQKPRHISPSMLGAALGTGVIVASQSCTRLMRKPIDILQPIRPPSLIYPQLELPTPVEYSVSSLAKEVPRRDSRDCLPTLIEEYILETDRREQKSSTSLIYHIRLSISQRPANSEFLGELYVDRDFRTGERNGESCQFSLGTRIHADRYIQQFIEIFTEEGRKQVKITHIVPGQVPEVTCTGGMQINHITRLLQLREQQHLHGSPQMQQSLSGGAQLVAANANQVMPSIAPPQQLFNTRLEPPQTILQVTPQLQHSQVNINNGSLVLIQPQTMTLSVRNSINSIANNLPSNSVNNHIMQSRLQCNPSSSTPADQSHVYSELKQQQESQSSAATTIHHNNPAINALVTSIINSANQFQAAAAAKAANQSASTSASSNAAIISLLNSAPAAMTNSPVVNSGFVTSPHSQTHILSSTPKIVTGMSSQFQESVLNRRTEHPRKANMVAGQLQNVNRIINSNLVSVGIHPNSTQVQQTVITGSHHDLNPMTSPILCGSMSSLANQLASPPALMSNPIGQNNYTFASESKSTNSPQQLITLSNCGTRHLNTANQRHEASARISPSSDSNASNSSSNLNYATNAALLAASPSSSHNADNLKPSFIERLSQQQQSHQQSQSPSPHFTAPSPKSNNPEPSPMAISPLSTPPPANTQVPSPQHPPQQSQSNTTTINLQGINLSSLQGAMATFPGLQNVQVQIPGMPQPISLPLSGAAVAAIATAKAHNTGNSANLLVSMPTTSKTHINPTMNAGHTASSTNTSTGNTGPMLSLPFGLNNKNFRTASGGISNNAANNPIQLVGIQRGRSSSVSIPAGQKGQLVRNGLTIQQPRIIKVQPGLTNYNPGT